MDKCPKCGSPEELGMIQDWSCGSIEEEDESVTESETCLRRQLAAANEKAGRLQAQMVELQKAWDILRHDDFVVNGGDRVNWNAHDEAKANIDRILGGA